MDNLTKQFINFKKKIWLANPTLKENQINELAEALFYSLNCRRIGESRNDVRDLRPDPLTEDSTTPAELTEAGALAI